MLQIFRLSAWLYLAGVPLLPRILYLLNRIVFSVVLPPTVQLGPRCTFAYQGLAVVVHARAQLGQNVYVGPQVIIGGRSGEAAVPVIGDHVFLGAGARVLGPVKIGAHATVAAGAVVLSDVPEGATVAGIPARVIHSTRRESSNPER